MPVIKKWLYSDKDIFVREAGLQRLRRGEQDEAPGLHGRGETAPRARAKTPWRIDVVADAEEGTLTFTDNGIGMTAEEVKKYIAQVAFSGAEEFLKKYKAEDGESGIIGHFGLGFYSAFMVSKKVVIDTKSYQEGAQAVRWISEDGMEYDLEDSDRAARGTSITLYLNDEDKEFANLWTLRQTLEKHCQFMPVPIYVSEVESAQGGRGGKGSARAGADQRHPSPVAEAPGGRQGRGVPRVLPQGVPRLRRAAVLDPLERRVSLQPQGHPLLPQAQKRVHGQRGRHQAVQQSGVRGGQHQGSHPRIPHAAQGRHRLPRPAAERLPLVLAERRLCEEDGGLHHPQGGRPPALRVQQPPRGLSEVLGRHPSLRQVRLHHATRSSTSASSRRFCTRPRRATT